MVNVALSIALATAWWLCPHWASRKEAKWYDRVTKHYVNKKKQRRLPRIRYILLSWFHSFMEIAASIALYLYFNGNCYFDQPRMYDEDDEADNINYVRGLVILLLFLMVRMMGHLWPRLFFSERRFRAAACVLVVASVFNAVVLWGVGSTEQCSVDRLTNRYWISFGLYLCYSVWLLVLLAVNVRWLVVVGPTVKKKRNEDYAEYKRSCRAAKKNSEPIASEGREVPGHHHPHHRAPAAASPTPLTFATVNSPGTGGPSLWGGSGQ
jgi:hypothetical protein